MIIMAIVWLSMAIDKLSRVFKSLPLLVVDINPSARMVVFFTNEMK